MSSHRSYADSFKLQQSLYDPKELKKACEVKVKKQVHKLGKFKMVTTRIVDEEIKIVEKNSHQVEMFDPTQMASSRCVKIPKKKNEEASARCEKTKKNGEVCGNLIKNDTHLCGIHSRKHVN